MATASMGGRRNGKSKAAIIERTAQIARQLAAATTHYEVLGVGPGATNEAIKDAHRALASVVHPDRNPVEEAHELIVRINQAYACLIDKDARKLYDKVNKIATQKCGACGGSGSKFKQQGFGKKVRTTCATCGGSGKC